jgi:hypothetical protein
MSLARNDSAPADGQGNSRVLSPVLEELPGLFVVHRSEQ